MAFGFFDWGVNTIYVHGGLVQRPICTGWRGPSLESLWKSW